MTQRVRPRPRRRPTGFAARRLPSALVALALLAGGCAGAPDGGDVGGDAADLAPPPVAPPNDRAGEAAPPPTGPADARGLPALDVALPALALEEVAVVDAPIDTAILADGTVLIAERGGSSACSSASDRVRSSSMSATGRRPTVSAACCPSRSHHGATSSSCP